MTAQNVDPPHGNRQTTTGGGEKIKGEEGKKEGREVSLKGVKYRS